MTAFPLLDERLLQRYDRPGPRYTSYPSAPHFRTEFTAAQLSQHAQLGNARQPPPALSLYVHVPFCQSPCFYCGCNRAITRDRERGSVYVTRVLQEAARAAPLFSGGRRVVQLHLGGGTPNFLTVEALGALIDGLRQRFEFSSAADRDYSIELDPRSLPQSAERYAAQLAARGFNRVSIGVQDFDPEVQKAVNRLQSSEQTLTLVEECRNQGVQSVNMDLIYGLPRQSVSGFRRTLRTVISARPDRIAIYGYAHLPRQFRAQRQICADELPDARARLELLRLAIEELGAQGYRYIGMDHFALPQDELARAQAAGTLQRNFMGYTTHAGCDLLGLGVSAISNIGDSYSQNFRGLREWALALDEGRSPLWRGLSLTPDDRVRAAIINQLMCHGRVDIRAIESCYQLCFGEYFADALELLKAQAVDGLVRLEEDVIEATPVGRPLLRQLAMCFDAYLSHTPAQQPMSQVI